MTRTAICENEDCGNAIERIGRIKTCEDCRTTPTLARGVIRNQRPEWAPTYHWRPGFALVVTLLFCAAGWAIVIATIFQRM